MQIQLPKLRKITENRTKKKILLLSDDLSLNSGIATMSREIVLGTASHYDWVQLGAAINHPKHGQIFDISREVEIERNIEDVYVKIYAHNGYGNAEVLREIIILEKPDAIMIFTDPRFWDWFFILEHEIHTKWKLPIVYWNIWDAPPAPIWNESSYKSCDLLLNISKQTHALVKKVLEGSGYTDLDCAHEITTQWPLVSYLPHGINTKYFFPIDETSVDYDEFKRLEVDFKGKNKVDFIVFWNNRNVRRKQPGDVILSFKHFCDQLSAEKASNCCLFMHTSIADPNGTDLMALKNAICPNLKVIFNEEALPTKIMNYFYNMADVTLNIASNEGFGLSNAESIMAGTMVIANVTGGLQDVMFPELTPTPDEPSNHTATLTKDHGIWCLPTYPTNRSLQGSIPTPFIFDDRCQFEDVGSAILEVYNMTDRKERGLTGREFMKQNFSTDFMCNKFIEKTDFLLQTFSPKKVYEFLTVNRKKTNNNLGILTK